MLLAQEEDAVEVVVVGQQCWRCTLVEVVVAQLEVDGDPVELGADVLLVDNNWSMLRKNCCRR